jgi:hypothetical protein
MTKFCKDCVNFQPNEKVFEALKFAYGKCFLTSTQTLNPITGEVEQAQAAVNRIYETKCGPDATWFERAGRETELRNEAMAEGC